MTGWQWVTVAAALLGAAGSVASLFGLRIAVRAERRARSAEAQVRAVVERNRRVLLAGELLRIALAARMCLEERSSSRAWEVHRRDLRTRLAGLGSLRSIHTPLRHLVDRALAELSDTTFRETETTRKLHRVLDEVERMHGSLIETLTEGHL